MAIDLDDVPDDVLAFLGERHLASLTSPRRDGTPHVAPVGFTYEPEARLARVITFEGACRVGLIGAGARVALCQIDGARWLTLEGEGVVTDDPERVAEAERRYAERYQPPRSRSDRVVVEIAVDRLMGRA
jgi:PPOX class probable F420-dependent enzyme